MVISPVLHRQVMAAELNEKLALTFRALKPGTRIVSHNDDMGKAWKPAKSFVVDNHVVHFWTVSKR